MDRKELERKLRGALDRLDGTTPRQGGAAWMRAKAEVEAYTTLAVAEELRSAKERISKQQLLGLYVSVGILSASIAGVVTHLVT